MRGQCLPSVYPHVMLKPRFQRNRPRTIISRACARVRPGFRRQTVENLLRSDHTLFFPIYHFLHLKFYQSTVTYLYSCTCCIGITVLDACTNHKQFSVLFASDSDDCTVKLWSMGQPHSLFSFPAKASLCSVKFNPHSRYLLAYGSADHGVHYIDLRNPTKPLQELMGHKKAVSYVDFIGSNELVSA